MKRSLFLAGSMILVGAISALCGDPTLNPVGAEYYTRVNIWSEKNSEITARNYHVGAMIPVGTKVKITGYAGDKIMFEIVKDGTACTVLNDAKHTDVDLAGLFARYFAEKDVTAMFGAFRKFSKDDQAHIRNGEIVAGMTRDAVIMSYGYPPGFKTPSVAGNVWTYWNDKGHRKRIVTFKDDIVVMVD